MALAGAAEAALLGQPPAPPGPRPEHLKGRRGAGSSSADVGTVLHEDYNWCEQPSMSVATVEVTAEKIWGAGIRGRRFPGFRGPKVGL